MIRTFYDATKTFRCVFDFTKFRREAEKFISFEMSADKRHLYIEDYKELQKILEEYKKNPSIRDVSSITIKDSGITFYMINETICENPDITLSELAIELIRYRKNKFDVIDTYVSLRNFLKEFPDGIFIFDAAHPHLELLKKVIITID